MKIYITILCLFLLGCSTSTTRPDVSLIRNHCYVKHHNCNLRNTYRWQKLPDKIDRWQYKMYAPYIQNCYNIDL